MNMRLYISNLTEEMGDDFDCIHSAFKLFNTYGLPVMQYEQKRDAESVLNMSTVATFFSAVTATTLQMSVSIQGDSPNKAIIIVNTFWFCSLVLSIGAALNSLMAGAWKRTPYGRRGRTLPLWVTIWIHLSAPVFLAASIACFSIGLVFFAYGSDQKNITSVFTLITTIVTFFGFITVASWILYERWIAPWVSTISDLHNHEAGPSSGGKAADSAELKASRPQLRRSRSDSISVHSFGSARSSDSSFSIGIGHLFRYLAYQDSPQAEQPCDPEIQTPVPAPEEEQREPRRGMTWGAGARAVALQLAVTKELWTKTARAVPRMAQTMRRAITASASVPNLGSPIPPFPEVPVGPSYRAFRTDFGVLQDLEYSPDGTILVATNYDNERQQSRTICYRITETLYTFGPCKHTLGQISKQVAWSQDGKRILVRLDRGIDILDSHCKQLSSIKRPHQVESAAWCDANSQDLVSVERNVVFKLSHRGQTLERYPFDNLLLRDIAVVPGARFLLAVGRVTPLHGEMLLPHNSRAEKQLICTFIPAALSQLINIRATVYDMQSKKYLSRNPVLDDVRHVTLGKQLAKDESSSFDVVLVHKDTPPPQIWTLSIHVTSPPIIRPKIPRTLLQADLPGPAYLAGDREQMVLCVGHNGDVQIRDREQGWLVDSVPAQVVTNNWRCVAWCPVPQHPDSITFATAGAKGLKIWYITVPPRQPELGPVSSRSQSPDRPLTIFEEPVSPTMTPAESSPPNERVLSST
ncbi:hypothetical protein FPV67DRAFT_1739939 [Lyophyllum atratum]|nr:hypothetical protein FPV67DRAFT_1739939 [Lyophyllum atratum]